MTLSRRLKVVKIFPDNQTRQFWINAQRFRDPLYLHHRSNHHIIPWWSRYRQFLKRWTFIHSWRVCLP